MTVTQPQLPNHCTYFDQIYTKHYFQSLIYNCPEKWFRKRLKINVHFGQKLPKNQWTYLKFTNKTHYPLFYYLCLKMYPLIPVRLKSCLSIKTGGFKVKSSRNCIFPDCPKTENLRISYSEKNILTLKIICLVYWSYSFIIFCS